MTEFWKSNPMHWCEYCKVWMQDNPQARATHEKGIKHKDNVARRLRQMRQTADRDVRDQKLAVSSMESIEAKAQRQYQQDLTAAQSAQTSAAGEWVLDAASGLFYNSQHRYYFDRSSRMYYGGDPPAWSNDPELPKEALYNSETPEQQGQQQGTEAAHVTAQSQGNAASSRPALNRKAHPLSQLGGYQMPKVGAIGGAKQMSTSVADSSAVPSKRRTSGTVQETPTKKAKLSEEEAAAVAKREAARARVQSRTMQAFGLA